MLRNGFMWFAAFILTFAVLIDGAPGAASGPNDKVSPSFTWGEAPVPSGAGISGVYHRLGLAKELNLAQARTVASAKHTYWCFFPDGRCYYSMPAEGLDNFNYQYVKGMNPLWCSTYKLKGDEGTITWGTGGSTVPFRRASEKLIIGRESDVYELLNPCNGFHLQGKYRREDWNDPYSPKEAISFSQDGTFDDEGFLGGAISTWWWAGRGLVNAKFTSGSGRYHVANNSLVLLYTDGRKVRANFHLADGATPAEVAAFIISTRRFVKVYD